MNTQPIAPLGGSVTPNPTSIDLASILCNDEIGQRSLDELMDSLLVTAIEGGSHYWCISIRCVETHPEPAKFGEQSNYPWYSVAFRAGVTLRVKPEGDKAVQVDRAAGLKGLALLLTATKCHARIAADLIQEKACADAEVADVWLQLAAFGEVVYG